MHTHILRLEQDIEKEKQLEHTRKEFISGVCSKISIDDSVLEKLPLFIQVVLMENIVDAFEVTRNNGEEPECDESLSYLIKCLEADIPNMGFFHEIYSCEHLLNMKSERFKLVPDEVQFNSISANYLKSRDDFVAFFGYLSYGGANPAYKCEYAIISVLYALYLRYNCSYTTIRPDFSQTGL